MLNEQVKRLFNRYGEILVDEYREQLIKDDTNASGQAAKSLNFKSNSKSLTIFGKSYILQIDTGTTPSDYKKGFPSPRALERWIKAKGITSNKYPKTKDLAFAISRRIVLPKLGENPRGSINLILDRLSAAINVVLVSIKHPHEEEILW